MKVYIVTSGEYSDYGIEKVFTDKEQAELYCALHESDYESPIVEEWDADDVEIEDTKPYMRRWEAKVSSSWKVRYIDDACTFKEKNTISKHGTFKGEWFYTVIATLDKDKTVDEAKRIIFDRLAAWKYEHEMEGKSR